MIKRMLRLNDNVRCFLLVFLFLICKNNNVEFDLSAGIVHWLCLKKCKGLRAGAPCESVDA